jgi:hypothetical protein
MSKTLTSLYHATSQKTATKYIDMRTLSLIIVKLVNEKNGSKK